MNRLARLEDWSSLLREVAAAAPAAVRPPLAPGAFAAPFAAAALGWPTGERPARPSPEAALWWATVDPSIDADELVAGDGVTLLPRSAFAAIETWTESELCALHALWRLARTRQRPDWRRRIDGLRRWHLEHTQPDNATHRPWALHVFVLDGSEEGRMYAETLLHNALAGQAHADPLVGAILRDAASEIGLAVEAGWPR